MNKKITFLIKDNKDRTVGQCRYYGLVNKELNRLKKIYFDLDLRVEKKYVWE